MKQSVYSARSIRGLLMAGAAIGAVMTSAAPALAQEIEEIVVTGSRIARQDYLANSPITTVSAESFQNTGSLTPENLLNQLPQVVPDITGTSNNPPGQGQAQINLRGLGANRNLVLVNGRRPTPSGSDGVVDVNTVPAALVERVEVVSGGASAVYGADAVAGVINFILKRDFEGVEADAQYGISDRGDSQEYAGNFTVGGNFAENRGNVVMSVGYANREELGKGERPFSAQATSTTSFFPSGTFVPVGTNAPTQAAVDSVFAKYNVAAGKVSRTGTLSFNPDKTLFAVGNATAAFDVQNYRPEVDQTVAQNFYPNFYSFNFEPQNKLILPLERVSVTSMGHFKLTDWVEVYAQTMYTNYNAASSLASSPAPTGNNITNPAAGAFFTVPVTNPFLPADLRTILASRTGDSTALPGTGANEDFLMRTRFTGLGPRVETYYTNVYQVLGGFKGSLPNGWNWDVYGAHGRVDNTQRQDGNVSVSAVERLLDAPDGGASICAGGLNLFGGNSYSKECADYIAVTAKNTTTIEHDVAEVTLSGDLDQLFTLPAGSVGFAVGGLYWKQSYEFVPDQVLATGDVAGFNAQEGLEGSVDNKDVYAEVLIPVLADLPGIQALNVTGGYRYSDHSAADTFSSYKIESDWTIVDALRVRGGYQRAVRAPNINELFAPQNEDNPQGSDPCDVGSTARKGANAAQVRALCLATGVAPQVIDTFTQFNSQFSALTGGNPNLTQETADTYTIGAVISSPFDVEALDRFTMSVDYYSIKIKDAIDEIDAPTTVSRCYDAAYNPNFSASNAYCTAFVRDATGSPNDVQQFLRNLATYKVSGIDTQVDWGFELPDEMGDLNFNLIVSYLDKFDTQIAAGDAFEHFAGSIGDDIGDALPEWKGTFTTTYVYDTASLSLRARYIDKMDHEYTRDGSNPDEPGVKSTWYFDMNARWQITDELSVRGGINNLFDQMPRLYPSNVQAGTDPSVYDVVGRRFYMGMNVKF